MLKNWISRYLDEELDFKERIFRVTLLATLGVCIATGIAATTFDSAVRSLFAIGTMFAVTILCMLMTVFYQKTSIAKGIFVIVMNGMFLPGSFLFNGGMSSGAPSWMSLGLLVVFLLFNGASFYIFLILTCMIDVVSYWISFSYPEWVVPYESTFERHFDSLFAVIGTAVVAGIVVRVLFHKYQSERETTEQQKALLDKSSAAEKRFFANMSHEIRTPINTIVGLNEMILREDIPESVVEDSLKIQNATKMLLELVNDILDYSKLDNQKMNIVPVHYDTKAMLLDVIQLIHVAAQLKDLDLNVDIDENLPSKMCGDERRIKQILINLLTNAVKYTKEGAIELRVRFEKMNDTQCELRMEISDTGIGIRKEELEHLYHAFLRVESEQNYNVQGTGLGLAITKQLVDLMGGEITVDSIYTKGSDFTVRLVQDIDDETPMGSIAMNRSKEHAARQVYKQNFEAPEARILLVDDNATNLEITARLLKPTKVQVDAVNSGEAALEKTLEKYYNVILLDNRMPNLSGPETLKMIRNQENGLCKDTAIVMLSADVTTLDEAGAEQLGFDGFLEKPIRGERLETAILNFLPNDIVEYRKDADSENQMEDAMQLVSNRRRKILITTDCVSDLPNSVVEHYGIKQMYFYIRTDNGVFQDTIEIDNQNLRRYMGSEYQSASSIAPTVTNYEAFFAKALTEADDVIHIAMAKRMGKSYGHAISAAIGFDHVHVIESGHVSGGLAMLVMHAARMALEGASVQDIIDEVEKNKVRMNTIFLMPGVAAFNQNGFMTDAQARFLGNLQMRPVFKIKRSGFMFVGARIGSIDVARKRFIKRCLSRKWRLHRGVIYISHGGCSVKEQQMIVDEVKKHFSFDRIFFEPSSVSNVCNTGIGTICITYVRK